MIPHERSLVEKWKDKPFALIGVDSDADLEQAKPAMAQAGVTWRSFWDGPKGTAGPIAVTWGVTAWPTIFVIDAAGKVRFRNVRGEALERAVESLLGELQERPPP